MCAPPIPEWKAPMSGFQDGQAHSTVPRGSESGVALRLPPYQSKMPARASFASSFPDGYRIL